MDDAQLATWPLSQLVALGAPLAYGLGAAWAFRSRRPVAGSSAATLALAASLTAAVLHFFEAPRAPELPGLIGKLATSVYVDAVSLVMASLVTFIGFIIARFSRTYLRGDPAEGRFAAWLLATLSSVSVLVIANHLVVVALAWVLTSLSLHQLLIFYPNRPQALIAAHKKFVVSRIADLHIIAGFALLALTTGSATIADIQRWADGQGGVSAGLELATVLLVLGACLKCAQLPFHGWLTQVMEAPTPVSALLHAGIVNIGGYLMLRLSPLLAKVELAPTLLVLVGSATAALAALVMMTRTSVKVYLAWSTCAQMGFMLLECGLGAYSLALLHLVAHSLYKAHAFLSAGSAVRASRVSHALVSERGSVQRWTISALSALLLVAGAAWVFAGQDDQPLPALALSVTLGLALAPLLATGGPRELRMLALRALVMLALYSLWHSAFGHLLPASAGGALLPVRAAIVVGSFAALFAAQVWLWTKPRGAFARRLYPLLYAGFYLDEVFTRMTFRVWSPKLPSQRPYAHYATPETSEA